MQKYKKESRLVYNLKGIARAIIPRFITQKQLDSKIANIFRIYDKKLPYIAKRLNLYNKITTPFSLPHSQEQLPLECAFKDKKQRDKLSRLAYLRVLRPNITTLKDNTPKNGSAYYYDSYEWTRYFDDTLRWAYLFEDVNNLLHCPALVKSRPIIEDNQNSIIMQLDKFRHFHFISDSLKFEAKKNLLFFRGAVYQEHRQRFFKQYFENPRCDIGHVGKLIFNVNPAWVKPEISIKAHLLYKFLLSLEGFDVASNLKWILSSNSLCIMPKPEMETWFMESCLQNRVHYAEIKQDYSDVEMVLDYYLSNPNEAKEITMNANRYCKQFFDKKLEAALNLLVLRKYFYYSGQIEITKEERELFSIQSL